MFIFVHIFCKTPHIHTDSQRESQGVVPACWIEKWNEPARIRPINFTTTHQTVGRFPSGSAYGAEGCQLVYISFVSLRQAEASSRRVLHDTMGQMDAMV